MNNQQIDNQPRQRLSQISGDEVDVINDIRGLRFGKINIVIQDGVIISKEITRIVKRKSRNGGRRNINRIINDDFDNGYNNISVGISDEESGMY